MRGVDHLGFASAVPPGQKKNEVPAASLRFAEACEASTKPTESANFGAVERDRYRK